jgi:8-amino-7-oxononanoate synthase
MTGPEPLQFIGENEVRLHNRTLVYFSGCDYFRLARNPRVAHAARSSLAQDGLNVAASRRTTGNHRIYLELESALVKFFDVEAALVLADGYLAPIAVAQALAGEFTHAFVDEFAHGALLDAARMLYCPVKMFKHRNFVELAKLIAKCGRNARPMVMTDGMFSHDGSVAPVRKYLGLLPAHGKMLVDDAHGAGVLGATGKGTLEHEGLGRSRVIQCATLSKAFGVYGGVVLGARGLRDKITTQSRAFIGTTPLPPLLAGAALQALKILRREPQRRKKLFENVHLVRAGLQAAGWDIAETPGPIIRLPLMSAVHAGALKSALSAAGIYPPFIQYGSASVRGVFRFVISSEHTQAQLDKLIALLTAFRSRKVKAGGKFFSDRGNVPTKGKALPQLRQ